MYFHLPTNPQLNPIYPHVIPKEFDMTFYPFQLGMVQQPIEVNQIYGFPQYMQNIGNIASTRGMGYPLGYGNEGLLQGNLNDQLKDAENSGNSNLSNLNTINNVIYQQKFQK